MVSNAISKSLDTIEELSFRLFDWAVWWFRRYCQNVGYFFDPGYAGQRTIDDIVGFWNSKEVISNPLAFRISHGYLEMVLDMDGKRPFRWPHQIAFLREQRSHLTWRNYFYGEGKHPPRLERRWGFESPPHLDLDPDSAVQVQQWLLAHVKFDEPAKLLLDEAVRQATRP